MGSISRVVLALSVVALGTGCKKPEVAPRPLDAGQVQITQTDAALATPPDRTLRVVAESVGKLMSLQVLPDGRVLVLGGAIAREALPDGTLAPLGGLAAYASLMPADDALVGYRESPQQIFDVTTSPTGELFFTGQGSAFRLEKGKLAREPSLSMGRRPVAWGGKLIDVAHQGFAWMNTPDPTPLPLAVDGRVEAKVVDSRGALVVLSAVPKGISHVVRASTFAKHGDAASVADLPVEGARACRFVPSFDRKLYASCFKNDAPHTFRRGDDGAWSEVFADVKRQGAVSIGPDGALYAAAFDNKKLEVKKCPADGAPCIALATDVRAPTANAASYGSIDSDVQEPETYRFWRSIEVDRLSPSTSEDSVYSVVARTPDDVWVLVGNGPMHLLLHSGPEKPSTRIGNVLDDQVLLRNMQPPQPWVGRCEALFVRLGPAKDEAAVAARAKEISGIVTPLQGTEYEQAFKWALVTGRLYEENVVGVVLARASFDGAAANLDRATERLVEKLAKNPVDAPRVSCTLPVLDRVLAPL